MLCSSLILYRNICLTKKFTQRAQGPLWFSISPGPAWCILPQTLTRSGSCCLSCGYVFCLPNKMVNSAVIFHFAFQEPRCFLGSRTRPFGISPSEQWSIYGLVSLAHFCWHSSGDTEKERMKLGQMAPEYGKWNEGGDSVIQSIYEY